MSRPSNHLRPNLGFSLVELSIVLVILGLLVGGVLSGQSLIRAAELRSVSTEYARYVTAVQSFRDKYFAAPGDMNNATRFWGRMNANADCVTNSAAGVVASGACDGNGSGAIDFAAAGQAAEFAQFWRHLANAGLIEGTYSGLTGAGSAKHCVVGTDCPRGKMSNSGWGLENAPNYGGDAFSFALDYTHTLIFGGSNPAYVPNSGILSPEEAWNIDTKLDDGRPAMGKVIGPFWNNTCSAADDGSSANNDYAASYRLSDRTKQCSLYFRQIF